MCVNDVVTIADLIDVGIQGAILEQLNLIERLSLAKDNKTRLLEFDTILLNRWEGSKVIKELGKHEVNTILRGDGGIAIHDLFSIHGEDASSSVKAKTLSSSALSLYLRYLNATQLSWGVYLNFCPYYDHWLAWDTPVGLQILIESVILAQLSGNVSEVENLNRELHTHNFRFQEVSSNVWRGEHIVEVRVKLGLEFFLGEMSGRERPVEMKFTGNGYPTRIRRLSRHGTRTQKPVMKNRKRLPYWRPQREIQLKKLQKHALGTGVTILVGLIVMEGGQYRSGPRTFIPDSIRPKLRRRKFSRRSPHGGKGRTQVGCQAKKFGKALAMILFWENVFRDLVNAQKGNAVRGVHEGIAIHDLFSIHIKGMSSILEAGALDISTEPLSLPKPRGKNNIGLVLKGLYPQYSHWLAGWIRMSQDTHRIERFGVAVWAASVRLRRFIEEGIRTTSNFKMLRRTFGRATKSFGLELLFV
ncbi:hypothetical protein K438DRAFT_1768512 [Mycena galopus ATCC 62051]|nr:hypothetical protein K438DRAFT_1768512 [Mycena galopus ATCC 62051]